MLSLPPLNNPGCLYQMKELEVAFRNFFPKELRRISICDLDLRILLVRKYNLKSAILPSQSFHESSFIVKKLSRHLIGKAGEKFIKKHGSLPGKRHYYSSFFLFDGV